MMIRVMAPVVLEQIHTTWNCHKRIPLLLILFFHHCRVLLIWKTLVILDSGLSDNEICSLSGEGTSDARANQLNMKLSQENTFTVQGCADIQNSLPAVAEVHHNPVMHGLTKKSAEAKGKRLVEEIKDEAYIKKGKMKVVNDN
ncbi:hypothetical protein ES288_D03G205800v1 [Gossypium darwinii]|nr:hypothetical protein ES288_D03G205800v1 [Gossypium darwinii]